MPSSPCNEFVQERRACTFWNDQVAEFSILPRYTSFEIDRESLVVSSLLIATGSFGKVYKGEMKLQVGIRSVAVKVTRGKITTFACRRAVVGNTVLL